MKACRAGCTCGNGLVLSGTAQTSWTPGLAYKVSRTPLDLIRAHGAVLFTPVVVGLLRDVEFPTKLDLLPKSY